ncbi:MAG: ABC transporter permease [Herpetosiphonaceae bacterium]|nr:ABC transporter permease [Herpetosiphonaceae bacterium]
MEVIGQRLPATIELALICFVVAMIAGVVAGTLAAYKPRGWADQIISSVSVILLALPAVWLGLLLIVIFAATLNILPSAGRQTIGGADALVDHLRHLVLPVLTLSAGYAATVALSVREVVVETLAAEYIRTARSKGLGEAAVVVQHALRNALIPIITLAGLTLPDLLGGSVVVETVFAWPGVGQLTAESVARRDYPVLLAVSLIVACAVLVSSLLADILYHVADPRIIYG